MNDPQTIAALSFSVGTRIWTSFRFYCFIRKMEPNFLETIDDVFDKIAEMTLTWIMNWKRRRCGRHLSRCSPLRWFKILIFKYGFYWFTRRRKSSINPSWVNAFRCYRAREKNDINLSCLSFILGFDEIASLMPRFGSDKEHQISATVHFVFFTIFVDDIKKTLKKFSKNAKWKKTKKVIGLASTFPKILFVAWEISDLNSRCRFINTFSIFHKNRHQISWMNSSGKCQARVVFASAVRMLLRRILLLDCWLATSIRQN